MPTDPQALAVDAHARHAHGRVRAQARRQTRERLKACLPAHHEQCSPRRASTAEPTAEIRISGTAPARHRRCQPDASQAWSEAFMQTQPHSVCHMTRRMACMRRTLMHGSRCAAVSSGAVGRQPHGASRRVTVGAGSHMHASRVQRAADSVSRTTAATTHRRPREQTCDGAVRARWRRAAGRHRAAQRTAGRVAHWLAGWPRARVGWGGAEGEGGTMHG